MRFTVVLSPDPGGGYSVTCPAMPGAVSQGATRDEALANAREAMGAWLEVSDGQGCKPLIESPSLISEEIASVLADRGEEGWDLIVETAVVELTVAAAA